MMTGNRMPTVIYIFMVIFYFLLHNKIRELFISLSIIIIIGYLFINFSNIDRIKNQAFIYFYSSLEILTKAPALFYNNLNDKERVNLGASGYLVHFNSGVQVWKKNKIFGHGLKSFPLNCKYTINQTCNTHPHNYFIEIMVNMGLIGIILIYSFIILASKNLLQYFFKLKNQKTKIISSVFFLIIFFEFFPIRSTGSFFTTSNASFIFLILPFFVNIKKLKNYFFFYKK